MKLHNLYIFSICICLLTGCASYKKVAYIQDSELIGNIQQNIPMYDAKIMPKDLLTITVNAPVVNWDNKEWFDVKCTLSGTDLACHLAYSVLCYSIAHYSIT